MTSENCIFGTTQKSKCLCGTGGHIYDCGCGKRQSLCLNAIARKESGELPQRVTKELLSEPSNSNVNLLGSTSELSLSSNQSTLILSKKRKAEDQDVEIFARKKHKESINGLFSSLVSNFPQYTFRINKSGDWVERKRRDGSYRRACFHGRMADECSDNFCLTSRKNDPSIRNRKLTRKVVPIESNPLVGRKHIIAPIIPFAGDMKKAKRRLQQYFSVWRTVPNEKMGSPCIFSTGTTYKTGQGSIMFDGRQMFAHTFSWMVYYNRELPKDFVIRHKCCNDNSYGCVQPLHLEIGTRRQNMLEDKIRDETLPVGENHHFASISNEKALQIYTSRGQGTIAERALRFSVSRFIIKKIDGGASWSNITGKHNFRIRERNRNHQRSYSRPRSSATPSDYEKAIKRIESHNYPTGNAKNCIYSTYCRDISGYPLTSLLGHQTRCSILTWEYYHNNCKIKPLHLYVLHSCDDEHCVNKDHLSLGTPSQNQLERWQRTGFKHIKDPKDFKFASNDKEKVFIDNDSKDCE